jgi:RNA polymerase sigma-70 factor (ECF subfamily)
METQTHTAAALFLVPPTPANAGWRNLSDEELIAAYREGWGPQNREEAADELFRRHQTRLTRWCCRFTRDRETASDLAQDIFLRAYRNLDSYRGECKFSTWLYVIARNQCMTAIQKRASEPTWVAKTYAADLADPSASDVHADVELRESRRKSWNFIQETLDRTEARVMMLHYGQELSLNTVTRMLGLTNKSGAKAYIVSARRKLSAAVWGGHDGRVPA